MPQQQSAEAATDHQDIALIIQRFTRDRRLRVDVVQIFLESALHRHVVGGAGAGFFEGAILGLFFRIEGRAGGHFRQFAQLLIGDDGIAFAGNLFGRLGGAGVENFQAGFRVDTDCSDHSSSSSGSSSVRSFS